MKKTHEQRIKEMMKMYTPSVGKSSYLDDPEEQEEEMPGYDTEDSPTYSEAKEDDPLAQESMEAIHPKLFGKHSLHISIHMGKKK